TVDHYAKRAIGLNCSVEFEVADCTTNTYPDNSFDVIYSSATIFHIQSDETPSPVFAEYIKQRGYDIHDVQAYGQDVIAEDRIDQVTLTHIHIHVQMYISLYNMLILTPELEKVEKEKEEYIHQRLLRSKKT
ncbi:hypothetical protein HID58_088646, partial [Brassica napus]